MIDFLYRFATVFYTYLLDIFPYFFIAVFITSGIQAYVNMSWFRKFLKGTISAPLITSALGGLMPVCSCSMVPVALMINNLSRSYAPVVSFLIVAPVISPVTVILTYALFGWGVTVFRVTITLLFALLVAYLVHIIFKKGYQIPISMFNTKVKSKPRLKVFTESFLGTVKLTGKYIILGILIASFIKVSVPSTWSAYISGTAFSYPLISLLSIPIYVCSGEDVPIAKALLQIGFTQGNSLTFMLASSGICLPTIMATISFLPKKIVVLYIFSWFLLSTLAGLFYDYFVFGVVRI